MRVRRNPPLPNRTREFARRLRTGQTDAESKLWYRLRSERLDGLKFRRQHPIPPHVLDFYCPELHLGIELDGSQHGEAADAVRTAALERQGVRLLRFWDNDVLTNLEGVLVAILQDAQRLRRASPEPSPPTPLPEGEGRMAR